MRTAAWQAPPLLYYQCAPSAILKAKNRKNKTSQAKKKKEKKRGGKAPSYNIGHRGTNGIKSGTRDRKIKNGECNSVRSPLFWGTYAARWAMTQRDTRRERGGQRERGIFFCMEATHQAARPEFIWLALHDILQRK